MSEPWTDERLDAALLALGDRLDIPNGAALVRTGPTSSRRRSWLAAAAAVVALVAGLLAVPPAREAVARWFGVRIERDDGASGTGSFADGVNEVDIDTSLDLLGLDETAFEAGPLGPPSAAGTPPEGGVVLAWPEGGTTLWVRPGDDDVVVVKRLIGSSEAELVPDVGDYAVIIDGDHVLDTPSRRVAAGRVLWWLADGQQWRLESQLDPTTMIAVARSLTAS